MKKVLLGGLFFITAGIYAQDLKVTLPGDTNDIAGTEITVTGIDSDFDVVADLELHNEGVTRSFKGRKIEAFYGVADSKNAVCWGICSVPEVYGDAPMVTTDALSVDAGTHTTLNGHVYPQGVSGDTKIRYVWFDVNNTNDSVYVDVVFEISSSIGVEENTLNNLNIFPNPATNLINVSGLVSGDKLLMRDLLGAEVLNTIIQHGTEKLDVSNYPRGAYLVTVIRSNGQIKTKKVTLTK